MVTDGLLGGSKGKESTCSVGDSGSEGWIPGSGRFPREGHGNSLQYSFVVNPTDRGLQSQRVGRD